MTVSLQAPQACARAGPAAARKPLGQQRLQHHVHLRRRHDGFDLGDHVEPDKTVCIIEAMKLFNEIESEVSGKIVKILADDASPVEYDQPLFLVEPN